MSTDAYGTRGRVDYQPTTSTDNPLIVTKSTRYVGGIFEVSTPFTGSRLVEDGTEIAYAVKNGDWLSGTLAGVSTVGDLVAAAIDPIGQAIAMGVGWLLDHVWPLNEWLNELTGDAGEVQAGSQTWSNITDYLGRCVSNLEVAIQRMQYEVGQAAETAKKMLVDAKQHLEMASELANALSFGLGVASTIVRIVHDLVRDAIGDVVGKMASAAIQEIFSLGLLTPKVIADVIALVNKWVARLTSKVKDLIRSIDALQGLFRRIDPILARLKSVFDRVSAAQHGVNSWANDVGTKAGFTLKPGTTPVHHQTATRFMGEEQVKHYLGDGATLGQPHRPVFLAPSEDVADITSGVQAAWETGFPGSVTKAAMNGEPVYAAVIDVSSLPQRVPIPVDAGGWQHYLPGGHTAVNIDGTFFPNATREIVVPGGTALPLTRLYLIDEATGTWVLIEVVGGK